MSLENWLNDGIVKRHQSSKKEVEDLLTVVDRCISDASVTQISTDLRYNTAYQAGLEMAKIALQASGYRLTVGKGHHSYMMQSIALTMGNEPRSQYLDLCRQTRNKTSYDLAGLTDEDQVEELLDEVKQFRKDLIDWIREHHKNLAI